MAAFRSTWFYWLLPVLLLAAWRVSLVPHTLTNPLTVERVFLFDFGLFIPLLYFAFLRRRVTLRAAIVRSLSIAAAGIAFAAWLLPPGTGQILPLLSWLRWIALPLIIVLELAAFIAIMRYAFSSDPREEELVAQGLPPLMVKLLLAEARFWKRIFRFLSGRN